MGSYKENRFLISLHAVTLCTSGGSLSSFHWLNSAQWVTQMMLLRCMWIPTAPWGLCLMGRCQLTNEIVLQMLVSGRDTEYQSIAFSVCRWGYGLWIHLTGTSCWRSVFSVAWKLNERNSRYIFMYGLRMTARISWACAFFSMRSWSCMNRSKALHCSISLATHSCRLSHRVWHGFSILCGSRSVNSWNSLKAAVRLLECAK